MAEKTQREMLHELYQAVVGIPDNSDDNGLIGDVKELIKAVKIQNGRISKNRLMIVSLISLLIGTGILEATNVTQMFGG